MGTRSLADWVRRWRDEKPDAVAFGVDGERFTWAAYDRQSTELAGHLIGLGLGPGDRVATLLADGPGPHVAWLATEKAGLVAVGIGSRAGDQEVRHLVERSGARLLLTDGRVVDGVGAQQVPVGTLAGADVGDVEGRGLRPADLFMLNSTSGTTGLPKLVTHTQSRWAYFHQLAADAGELTGDDVFCSAIPSPFGFGLWTAHFTPTYLGAPVHVMRRFEAAALTELIERERVSVLAAVTTQLIMLLNEPALDGADLGSLRVVFTGGEAVPYAKAAEFEDRTGCRVLQFYGSNETGAASRTTLRDDRQHRLTTAGRVIEEMSVRLYDPVTGERVDSGRGRGRGQPACRGPATCDGYYDDPAGNAELYTDDGWMLMGDIVEIDADGYLTVVGRTSDIIIRGGKNISAAAVEAEVMTHPAVAMAAVVAAPDPVFGERVCAYVELAPGYSVTLDELRDHLDGRGVTREWMPEYLVELGSLPRSSGGKVAKGELRAEAARRFGT